VTGADVLLSASHVSKKFARQLRRSLWYGVRDTARELLLRSGPTGLRPGEFWAVDDVSFELARGESLALIGGNGAGKSTLLKVLFGLLKADRGEVHVRGEMAALIELGTGFQPQLTARENIRLVAALNGFSARDTAELHERVADFAGLGDLIEAPVQSYSTGMRARLAYSLAAQLDPAILLVDEVLAVGDLSFQRKCAMHMSGFLDRGGSLLFVSHNTHQVQSLCRRAILLDQGRQVFAGSATEALTRMFELRLSDASTAPPSAPAMDGPVVIRGIRVEPAIGEAIFTGEPLRLFLDYEAKEAIDVYWGFSIWTWDQWICVAGEHDPQRQRLEPGTGTFTGRLPRLPLVGGKYSVHAAVLDFQTHQPIALACPATLDVLSGTGATGNSQMASNQLVRVDVDWP
jgi:ABC-type polysaccharide/polyol phosphate transport system ATPase subunit